MTSYSCGFSAFTKLFLIRTDLRDFLTLCARGVVDIVLVLYRLIFSFCLYKLTVEIQPTLVVLLSTRYKFIHSSIVHSSHKHMDSLDTDWTSTENINSMLLVWDWLSSRFLLCMQAFCVHLPHKMVRLYLRETWRSVTAW